MANFDISDTEEIRLKTSHKPEKHRGRLERNLTASLGVAAALTASPLCHASFINTDRPDPDLINYVSSHTELPTSRIQSSLKILSRLLPDQPEYVHEYAKILADNLNPNLVPEGFLHQARTTIGSIYNGSIFLPEKTRQMFDKLTTEDFIAINDLIPLIAEQTCRPDFASAVRAHSEKPNNWLIKYLKKDLDQADA